MAHSPNFSSICESFKTKIFISTKYEFTCAMIHYHLTHMLSVVLSENLNRRRKKNYKIRESKTNFLWPGCLLSVMFEQGEYKHQSSVRMFV